MYLHSEIMLLVYLDQPLSQVIPGRSHADHLLSAPFPILRPCFVWFAGTRRPIDTAGLSNRRPCSAGPSLAHSVGVEEPSGRLWPPPPPPAPQTGLERVLPSAQRPGRNSAAPRPARRRAVDRDRAWVRLPSCFRDLNLVSFFLFQFEEGEEGEEGVRHGRRGESFP